MKNLPTILKVNVSLLVLCAMVVSLLPPAAHAASSDVVLLQDGFEGSSWTANWDNNGATKWYHTSSAKHSGSYSAAARDGYEGVLTSDNLNAADASAIKVDFWFRKRNTGSTDFTLYYYDGTTYNLVKELSPLVGNDVWSHYTETITDSRYFKSNFRIRFDGYNLASGVYTYVDDVLITKTVPIADDTTAPTPNPMTWATPPYAIGTTSISMTATTASDTSGVQYYFACVSGGGHDSGWLDTPIYTDTGLQPNTEYSYQVKARDKSANLNETACSDIASALTLSAGNTKNILLTGYWPPSNEMLRKFSNNPTQNPAGWQGQNWEGRGYNIYAYFPEFPGGTSSNPKGNGDFEIDYQDVSSDFWRITGEIHPIAILSFGQGAGPWEIEYNARNLSSWSNDYLSPTQPTPCPPDSSVATGYVRNSTLPVQAIADAINASGLGINAWVDWSGNPGAFLCEYMAYHDMWYQSLHSSPDDQYRCVAAGFTHVAAGLNVANLTTAVEIALRTTTDYLDSQLLPHYTLTVDIVGNGSVQANPNQEYYDPNTAVTLTATPNSGATFTGWTGDVNIIDNPLTIIMDADKYITANFAGGFSPVTILGSWTSGTSHTAEIGANRLLIFTAHVEDDDTAMNLSPVTYGGQPMTKVIESNTSTTGYRSYVVAYILGEDGISKATSNTFTVKWAQTPYRLPTYSSAFLGNVNQTAPVGAKAANSGTTATLATAALAAANGDMVILAGTNGNTGTYTVNNSFTKAIELTVDSGDGVCGYKPATGAAETPSITHSYANRQVIIGFTVQAQ